MRSLNLSLAFRVVGLVGIFVLGSCVDTPSSPGPDISVNFDGIPITACLNLTYEECVWLAYVAGTLENSGNSYCRALGQVAGLYLNEGRMETWGNGFGYFNEYTGVIYIPEEDFPEDDDDWRRLLETVAHETIHATGGAEHDDSPDTFEVAASCVP